MGHQHKNITKLDGFSHLLGKHWQALCLVLGAGWTDTTGALSSQPPGGGHGGAWGVPVGAVEQGGQSPGKD